MAKKLQTSLGPSVHLLSEHGRPHSQPELERRIVERVTQLHQLREQGARHVILDRTVAVSSLIYGSIYDLHVPCDLALAFWSFGPAVVYCNGGSLAQSQMKPHENPADARKLEKHEAQIRRSYASWSLTVFHHPYNLHRDRMPFVEVPYRGRFFG